MKQAQAADPIRENLFEDPTHFEGPESIEAQLGTVKGVYFRLNATDGFISKRSQLDQGATTLTSVPPRSPLVNSGQDRCAYPSQYPRTPTSALTSHG